MSHPHRRLLPLLALLVPALFPIGWLAAFSPWINYELNYVFADDASHAVGHISIFLVVGLAALLAFPVLRVRPLAFAATMLLLGVAQEGFQLLYKQRPIGFDEFRDFGTDIIGFMVAFLVWQTLKRHSQ